MTTEIPAFPERPRRPFPLTVLSALMILAGIFLILALPFALQHGKMDGDINEPEDVLKLAYLHGVVALPLILLGVANIRGHRWGWWGTAGAAAFFLVAGTIGIVREPHGAEYAVIPLVVFITIFAAFFNRRVMAHYRLEDGRRDRRALILFIVACVLHAAFFIYHSLDN